MSLYNLAAVLFERGDCGEADTLLRQSLDVARRCWGEKHPGVAYIRERLGIVTRAQGDLAAAETQLRRALEIRHAVLSPGHRLVAVSMVHLGSCLGLMNRGEEAEALLEDGVRILEETLGPDDHQTRQARDALTDFQQSRGERVARDGTAPMPM